MKNAMLTQTAAVALSLALHHVCQGETPKAVFDHSTNEAGIQSVNADPGDTIAVVINNTCTDLFAYAATELRTVKPPAPEAAVEAPAAAVLCTAPKGGLKPETFFKTHVCTGSSQDVFVIHDSKNGGYLVSIQRRPSDDRETDAYALADTKTYNSALQKFTAAAAGQSCSATLTTVMQAVGGKKLQDTTETVVVGPRANYVEYAGGVTVSNLVDPKFALGPNPSGVASDPQVIIEDRSAEDRKKLGFAGFLHVHNPNCSKWAWLCDHTAASLGLGISSGSNVSIFLGGSYRLSGQWFATLGYNWGAVDRLPNGERLGHPPTTSNALSNLGSRTSGAIFFSLSYAFLNPGTDFFKKPFTSAANAKPQGATQQ
jgi:hypothetical protein